MSSASKPASRRRSDARLRTRPCAHGHALIPVASTPTARRVPVSDAAAMPQSVTISCVARFVTGVRRWIGHCARIQTSARSAPWRSTTRLAMCSASTSTRSASRSTTSSIASSKSSGKRDMWTPFWSAARSTVQSITAAITVEALPRRMRTAFWTPETPARESASAISGDEAWRSSASLTSLIRADRSTTSQRSRRESRRSLSSRPPV